ncbi:MAG: GAF domain-containing sensor histidine kinase [Alphaproteobacteria bacterium]
MSTSTRQYPVPLQEEARLRELHSLRILDSEPEPEFDRVTRLLALVMKTPIALVTLVDDDRQWFKSCIGVDIQETARDNAICAHAIMSDDILVCTNLSQDSRFFDNPLVSGETHVRFYAGMPLVTRNGFRIGTICAVDTEPREYPSSTTLDAMRDLAQLATDAIERRADRLSTEESRSIQLKNADDAKEAFLAMLNHEMRTPLNAIIGFSSLITMNAANDISASRTAEYAKLIEQGGYTLLHRIETMLNWTQVQRGEIVLEEESVPVAELIERGTSSVPEIGGMNDNRPVEIVIQDDCPELKCDPDQMGFALENIVRNALQATAGTDPVRIDVQFSGNLEISVVDHGPGIPTEAIEHAMAPFGHVENSPAQPCRGLGLGLPLSRKIIEMHGGHLDIVSSAGSGTRVTFRFPAYRTAAN